MQIDILSGLRRYEDMERFKQFLPKPIDVENIDGRFAIRSEVPIFEIYRDFSEKEEYLAYAWKRMYQQLTLKVAELMVGRDEYFVLKFIPIVQNDYGDYIGEKYIMSLYVDITVAQSRNVVIPEFVYDPISLTPKIVEWRCGHCHMPNPMEAKYCGEIGEHPHGCGAPRALLIQELSR